MAHFNRQFEQEEQYQRYIKIYNKRLSNTKTPATLEMLESFFPMEKWPKHMVRILFKLPISGETGDKEAGHIPRLKLVAFLYFNACEKPCEYIATIHPGLRPKASTDIKNILNSIKIYAKDPIKSKQYYFYSLNMDREIYFDGCLREGSQRSTKFMDDQWKFW